MVRVREEKERGREVKREGRGEEEGCGDEKGDGEGGEVKGEGR
jgi:hypothetical protein